MSHLPFLALCKIRLTLLWLRLVSRRLLLRLEAIIFPLIST